MKKPQNIIAQIIKNVKKKNWNCLVNDCEKNSINSHLIQQNGLLSNITVKGHLIELKMSDANRWRKEEIPYEFKHLGIRQALSYKVFCNEHDTEIFEPIEKADKDFESYEAFTLFSYRAVCAEIRKKMMSIEQHNRIINANTLDGKIDKESIQLVINGNESGLKDLNFLKEKLEKEIESKEDKYSYFTYKYPKIDIYASAVFSANDLDYPKEDGALDVKNIYIHILPLEEEIIISTGYHNEHTSDEIKEWCKSWDNLSQEDLELKLTELFSRNIENWGISPSLFEKLKNENKKKYIEVLKKNASYFGIAKNKDHFNLFETA
ncbi:hypothetical protein INR75_15210 [Zunongwangia sp. SCSIO 43204]|uniref:hypothetical protein n=1 Tax=Zunongwangia sp. SCSIO 43204 TaxID=2779359 RepID=UPI001CA855D1|nr:hypothetical protein [Zunongwangia sp. SCSIO 43204]UAB83510.1 hypothetical protein INR75_15210 [Zunongwangia sp. SCSIO 43204]